jgi:hypothetical protein
LKSLRENLTFLTDIKDIWSTAKAMDPTFPRLIVQYASYLIDRLSFSRVHPAFEGNFALDRFTKTSGDLSPLMGQSTPFNTSALLGLVDLLNSLVETEKAALADMTSPCKHGAVIPLVYDAEDLVLMINYLTKRVSKSIKSQDLNQIVSKFNTAYPNIIRFFTQVEKFPPLNAIAKVPQIPVNPPSVFATGVPEPPKSTPPPPHYLRGNRPKQDYDEGFESDLDEQETIDSENTAHVELNNLGEVSVKRIIAQPGNGICADCPAKDPRTAVTNLGILICDPCVNIHKTLGEAISKTQPLDDNLSLEQMRFLESLGNERANKYWEATLVDPQVKPTNPSNSPALNTYIRNKYLGRRFAPFAALKTVSMPRNLSGNLATMGNQQPRPMGPPMQQQQNFNMMNQASPARTRSFDVGAYGTQQSFNVSPSISPTTVYSPQLPQTGVFNPQQQPQQFLPPQRNQTQHQRVPSNGLENLNVFQQFGK